MANKSVSAMKNINYICCVLRRKYYGNGATEKDYKDSYVVNQTIHLFPIESRQMLMDEWISEKDKTEIKVSKSINFRSDCYEKLKDIAKMLDIPEAEVLRRILYYSLDNNIGIISEKQIKLSSLKSKVALLQKQMETSMVTLNKIVNEIAQLEVDES